MKIYILAVYCWLGMAAAFAGGTDFKQTKRPDELAGIKALTPPFLELTPGPQYWPRVRMWQGVPSIERAKSGRLWATWYAGLLGEGKGQNYAALVTSTDDGKTWSKPVAVCDPSRNFLNADVDNPHLWMDPNGKMWWFINRVMLSRGESTRTSWGFYTEDPDSPRPTWKGPVFAGWGLSLNKPALLADGTWFHTVDHIYVNKDPGDPLLQKGAHLYKFVGYDKPFEHVGFVDIKNTNFTEHMLVERKDGSLWMLARTKYGLAQAESNDGGKTWTELEPFTKDFNVNVRFFFRRLASGHLLLVVCDDAKARTKLTAMLSKDEGKTWPYKLLLDERQPVGYPDALQTPDGQIYVIYDYGRYLKNAQELLLAKISEADIEAGKLISPGSFLKQTVNRLADEGGGIWYDGETWDMRKEFEAMNPGDEEVKKEMQLLDGEKAGQRN